MKKYLIPKIEMFDISATDVITASFGNLEELPSGDDTPIRDIVQSEVDW